MDRVQQMGVDHTDLELKLNEVKVDIGKMDVKEAEFRKAVDEFAQSTQGKYDAQWQELNGFAVRLRTEIVESMAGRGGGGDREGEFGTGGVRASRLCNSKETTVSKLPDNVDKATFSKWRTGFDLHLETHIQFKNVTKLPKKIGCKDLPVGEQLDTDMVRDMMNDLDNAEIAKSGKVLFGEKWDIDTRGDDMYRYMYPKSTQSCNRKAICLRSQMVSSSTD